MLTCQYASQNERQKIPYHWFFGVFVVRIPSYADDGFSDLIRVWTDASPPEVDPCLKVWREVFDHLLIEVGGWAANLCTVDRQGRIKSIILLKKQWNTYFDSLPSTAESLDDLSLHFCDRNRPGYPGNGALVSGTGHGRFGREQWTSADMTRLYHWGNTSTIQSKRSLSQANCDALISMIHIKPAYDDSWVFTITKVLDLTFTVWRN